MNKIATLLIMFILPLTTLATRQGGDIIYYMGKKQILASYPLQLLKGFNSSSSRLFDGRNAVWNAGCGLGIAEWNVTDDQIYLTNIYSCSYWTDSIKADLKQLFPDVYSDGKVKATWITADLEVQTGKCINFINDITPIYEKEIVLTFEEGKLINTQEFDNSKSRTSIFYHNYENLKNFIDKNIDWSNLPNLNGKTLKVLVSAKSGEFARPDSVKIYRGVENKLFNNEALRVINSLPDWDIYYKQGKVITENWVIPVVFSEENRKKYAH